jgi:putative flippase GtrA
MLAFRYGLYAAFATVVNLLTQTMYFMFDSASESVWVGMTLGTIVGLIVKYFLDKRFIFGYQAKSFKDDSVTFFSYSLVGLFTTSIFWGLEISFHYAFDHPFAKYAGAAIGLSIGYYIKYHIDKRYVFDSNG